MKDRLTTAWGLSSPDKKHKHKCGNTVKGAVTFYTIPDVPDKNETAPYDLSEPDECVDPTLRDYIQSTDGTALANIVEIFEVLGTPSKWRDAFATAPPKASSVTSLSSETRSTFEALRKNPGADPSRGFLFCFPLSPLTLSGSSSAPFASWSEVAENLHNALDVLGALLEGHGKGVYYRMPPDLQSRLLPVLYAWVVDWDVVCRFPRMWCSIAKTMCLAIGPVGKLNGPQVTLDWRPLLELVRTVMDPPAAAQSHLSRAISIARDLKEHLPKLCVRCATCFPHEAVYELWKVCKPMALFKEGLYLYIFRLLCPVRHLPTPDYRLPQPLVEVCELLTLSHQRRVLELMVLCILGAVAEEHPGLLCCLEEKAEPLFTVLRRLATIHSSTESATQVDVSPPNQVLIAHCVFLLPSNAATPLWNHLRRLLEAVNVCTVERDKIETLCCHMIKFAIRRMEIQKKILGDASAGLTMTTEQLPGSSSIPDSHVWTATTVTKFAEILMKPVFESLNFSNAGTKGVAALACISPALVADELFERTTAAFRNKAEDLKTQMNALHLLQKCCYSLLSTPETSETFLQYVREVVVPRLLLWLNPSNSDAKVSKTIVNFVWTLSTTMKMANVFSEQEEEFASRLTEHVVVVTTHHEMEPVWFTALSTIFCSMSDAAFDLVARKLLKEANGQRGSWREELVSTIGSRDAPRLMSYVCEHSIPLLMDDASSDEDVLKTVSAIGRCLTAVGGKETFKCREKLVQGITHLLACVTKPRRLKAGEVLYAAMFSALMEPRCSMERRDDEEAQDHPYSLCGANSVQLRWESAVNSESLHFLVNFLDSLLDDVQFVVAHISAARVEDCDDAGKTGATSTLRSLRELVKPPAAGDSDTITAASSAEASTVSIVQGLAQIVSLVVNVNALFYHISSAAAPAAQPLDATTPTPTVCTVPTVHWGFQTRCCSLTAYTAEFAKTTNDAAILSPKHSLDDLFDMVYDQLLPIVRYESIPVADNAFGDVLQQLIPSYISAATEVATKTYGKKESATALQETLRALATTCGIRRLPPSSPSPRIRPTATLIDDEISLYLGNYTGGRSHTMLFPQSYWLCRAKKVFKKLKGNYHFSASHRRHEKLCHALVGFLCSGSAQVSMWSAEALASSYILSNEAYCRHEFAGSLVNLIAALIQRMPFRTGRVDFSLIRKVLASSGHALSAQQPTNRAASEMDDTLASTIEHVLTSLLVLIYTCWDFSSTFGFNDLSMQLLRILLAAPVGRLPLGNQSLTSIDDCGAAMRNVEELVKISFQLSVSHASHVMPFLTAALRAFYPYCEMNPSSHTFDYLIRLSCDGASKEVQKAARELLSSALLTCGEMNVKQSLGLLIPNNVDVSNARGVFIERYKELHAAYPYPIFTDGPIISTCLPSVVRYISRNAHQPQLPDGESAAVWRSHLFGGDVLGSNTWMKDRLLSASVDGDVPWIASCLQNSRVSETHLNFWCCVTSAVGNVAVMVQYLQGGLKDLLSSVQGANTTSSTIKAGEDDDDNEQQLKYKACLSLTVGIVKSTKEGSEADRKKAMGALSELLECTFTHGATRTEFVTSFLSCARGIVMALTLDELRGLYDRLVALLKPEDARDAHQHWISSILRALTGLLSVECDHNLLLVGHVLEKLKDISEVMWYGRTPTWRGATAKVLRVLFRLYDFDASQIFCSAQGDLKNYVESMMSSIDALLAAAEPEQVESRLVALVHTFALSCSPCYLMTELYRSVTEVMLRCFSISRAADQSDLETHVSSAIVAIARSPMTKASAHEVLEFWCGILLEKQLPRRARSALTGALTTLLSIHMHRIGKYETMITISNVAIRDFEEVDACVRLSASILMRALTQIASRVQVDCLMASYTKELENADLSAKRRYSLVMACCEVICASSGVPSYVPRVMCKLDLPLNEKDAEVKEAIRNMFNQWFHAHRDEWESRAGKYFSPSQIAKVSNRFRSSSYFA